MLRLVTAVVCEGSSETAPHTLVRVRKQWRSPPEHIAVYLEVVNYTGDVFDFTLELWHRGELVIASPRELVPLSIRGTIEICTAFEPEGATPHPHELRVLLNGGLADTLYLDFGYSKAAI